MQRLQRERVKDLFDRARVLSPEQQDALIEAAANEGPEAAAVAAEVRALLAELAAPGGLLDNPTGGAAAVTAALIGQARESPGSWVGRYKLLELIGEGGFGLVYMAEQERPIRRRVALKVIKLGMDTRQVIARFEQERQALAMMDHPNIAKVLDAGTTSQGRPYFVMELVRGEPITTFCDARKLSVTDRLKVFAAVCHAVQHAHQKGIIHRDLKPSNVLVTVGDGDVPVPKVIDFGIAKATQSHLTERTLFTEFRQLIGTPEYMSPEQAGYGGAGGVDIDTRSDVYSLGVLLYELLTGVTPFDAARLRSAAFGELQRIIREIEPPRPSTRLSTLATIAEIAARRQLEPERLRSTVRGELDWIVMRCLDKDRARRYAGAAALAQDLERYLTQQPLEAGPPGTGYRARKFFRRNRRMAVAGGLLAVSLILGLIGTSASTVWALREKREARSAAAAEAAQRSRADENSAQSRALAYRLAISSATANLQTGDVGLALAALEHAPPELRGWEWSHLMWVSNPSTIGIECGAGTDAMAVSAAAGLFFTRSEDGAVRIFELATGQPLRSFRTPPGRTTRNRGLQLNSPGSMLYVSVDSASGRDAGVWDTATGRRVWTEENPATAHGSTFGGSGQIWLRRPGGASLLDVLTGEVVETIEMEGPPPITVHGPIAGTRRVIVHTIGSNHVVWDLDQRQEVVRFGAYSLRILPDEPVAISYITEVGLKSIDVVTGQVQSVPVKASWLGSNFVMFALGAGLLCVENARGVMSVYDRRTGDEVTTFRVPARIGQSNIHFDRRLRKLFVLDSGCVRVLDLGCIQQPFVVEAPSRGAYAGAVSPTARSTAIVGWGDVAVFDAQSGENLWTAYPTRRGLYAVAFSPNEQFLAVAGLCGDVAILDARNGRIVSRLPVPGDVQTLILTLAWSPDGGRLLAGAWDGRILEFAPTDLAFAAVQWPDPHTGPVSILEFSPDGAWIISGSSSEVHLHDFWEESWGGDNSLRLRHASDGRVTRTLIDDGRPPLAAAFDPSSSLLAVSAGTSLSLQTFPQGRPVAAVEIGVRGDAMTFSPDGARLVVADKSHKLRLLSTADLSTVAEWPLLSFGPRRVRFAPDRSALVISRAACPVTAYETGPPRDPGRRDAVAQASGLINGEYRQQSFVSERVREIVMSRADLDRDVRQAALAQIEVRGDDPNSINNATWLRMESARSKEDHERLVEQAEAALRAAPADSGLRLTMGIVLCRAGMHERALAELQTVAAKTPESAHAKLTMCWSATAVSRHHLGDQAGALEALATAQGYRDKLGHEVDRYVRVLLSSAQDALAAP